MSEAAEKLRFRVGGMDCAACVTKIENAVGRLPGVGEVGVSLPNGTMTVTRSGDIAKGAIERQVKALGYQIAAAKPASTVSTAPTTEHHSGAEHDHSDRSPPSATGRFLSPWRSA